MTRFTADRISVTYGRGRPHTLHEFDIEIGEGEFVGVVGPNGSGKSTLVRALSRTLRPISGSISLGGDDLYAGMDARASARAVAVVPQNVTTAFDFRVRDLVSMGRYPHASPRLFAGESETDAAIVHYALRASGITHLADRIASTLSGGEQQRALIARALAQEAQIILMDEPIAHLDIRHQVEVLEMSRSLARDRGRQVLAVLHDLNLAAAYCDRLVLMSEGAIIAQGTPDAVLTSANIQAAYGVRVWVRRDPITGSPALVLLPELPPTPTEPARRVHVICGGGSGAPLLAALRQRGASVTAGVLSLGDIDHAAAVVLGIEFVDEKPFTPFSAAACAIADRLAQRAEIVIVTEVSFGVSNLAALESAHAARLHGARVLCILPPGVGIESRDFTDGLATQLWNRLLSEGAEVVPDIAAILTACRTSEV